MSQPSSTFTRCDFLQVAGAGLALGSMPSALRAEGAATSTFAVRLDGGAIVSLKRVGDAFDTDYILHGRRAGDQTSRLVAKIDEDVHVDPPLDATLTSVSIERSV